MADNVNDVLQELSILLRRISEQNDASMKRQDERKSEKNERRDLLSKLRQDSKLQVEEGRLNSEKNKEIFDRHRQEDLHFRERLIQTLEHQNQLLESLIARLKENPKKG